MKRSLMVVYSTYPADTRIRKEANALVKNGYSVDIICLQSENQSFYEIFENITIYRLSIKKQRGSLANYIKLYIKFFIIALFRVSQLFLKKKYDVIHVHNMPNFIVFVALLPKIFGAKVILDLHDPSPEIFLSVSNKTYDSFLFRLALLEEKMSIWFADQIITTNIAFKELFVGRGCKEDKVSIIMNSPQTDLFNKVTRGAHLHDQSSVKNFKIMYNGTIIERHGLDYLIDTIELLKDIIPGIELHIFGSGEFLENILKKINEQGLNDYIKYRGTFLVEKIAEEIPLMDLGVIPNRFNIFTNLNFPIRVFEFIHFRKPIIVPRTKGLSDYFNEDEILFFEAENKEDLAEKIMIVYNNKEYVNDIINKSYKIYENNRWEIQANNLLNIYNKF